MRWILIQCAHASIRTNSMINDFYSKIAKRRGDKKAVVAVARKLVKIIYAVLSYQCSGGLWMDFYNISGGYLSISVQTVHSPCPAFFLYPQVHPSKAYGISEVNKC